MVSTTCDALCPEHPRRINLKHVSGFDSNIMQTTGMMQLSLQAQRKWREEFEQEKKRMREIKAELAAIHRIRKAEEREARLEEFNRNHNDVEQRSSVLPDPVLYPLSNVSAAQTGIPQFQLLMRVDIQVLTVPASLAMHGPRVHSSYWLNLLHAAGQVWPCMFPGCTRLIG